MSGSHVFAGVEVAGPSAAETQRCFRALLDAMAHPGRVVPLGLTLAAQPDVSTAGWALCLTLLDRDTQV